MGEPLVSVKNGGKGVSTTALVHSVWLNANAVKHHFRHCAACIAIRVKDALGLDVVFIMMLLAEDSALQTQLVGCLQNDLGGAICAKP